MGNILDYIRWRGDLSFARSPFNEVDNLIFACLSYLNLDGMEEVQGSNGLSLPQLSDTFFSLHTEEELSADTSFVSGVPYMMRDMAKTRRFGNCAVRNYVNEILLEEEQQFSAMEILLEDGSTYVAFRGTDDTIVGWKEDFNLCNGVVPAQEKAAQYLEHIGEKTARMLRVGGHSKGGNLAVYASAHCSSPLQHQILEIYCNDGPGFPRELLEQKQFESILPKVKRIIPEFSVIGMLLGHKKQPLIVKSSQKGLLQHDGFSWEVEGPAFLKADELNQRAAAFQNILHRWIDSMDAAQRSSLINDLFSVIEASGTAYVSHVQEGNLKSALDMLKRIEKFPPESRTMIQELINALFEGWLERLHLGVQARLLQN